MPRPGIAPEPGRAPRHPEFVTMGEPAFSDPAAARPSTAGAARKHAGQSPDAEHRDWSGADGEGCELLEHVPEFGVDVVEGTVEVVAACGRAGVGDYRVANRNLEVGIEEVFRD